jgi:hypothetical protein
MAENGKRVVDHWIDGPDAEAIPLPVRPDAKPSGSSVFKLLSGLELWFSDDGKAYTVPSRSEIADVRQTAAEVEAWLGTHRPSRMPSKRQIAMRRRADSEFWRYVDVQYWLDVFEDQFSYLSGNMPERQKREVSKESSKETFERLFGTSKKKSSN